MSERSWSPRFEVVLRQYLPLLAEGEALHPEAWLTDLGLDSLGVVGLLAELADEFGAGPDLDTLDPALFANPRHAVGGGPTGGSGRHPVTTISAPALARLTVAVQRVRRVPDLYRRFTEPVAAATREHLLDAALLGQLVELGLPVSGRSDDRHFDPLDLANVALALGLPTPRLVTMRGWRSALLRAAGGAAAAFQLRVRPRCPSSIHGPECGLAVAPELAAHGAMAGPPRRAEPH